MDFPPDRGCFFFRTNSAVVSASAFSLRRRSFFSARFSTRRCWRLTRLGRLPNRTLNELLTPLPKMMREDAALTTPRTQFLLRQCMCRQQRCPDAPPSSTTVGVCPFHSTVSLLNYDACASNSGSTSDSLQTLQPSHPAYSHLPEHVLGRFVQRHGEELREFGVPWRTRAIGSARFGLETPS